MHVLLIAIGSHGDVLPFIALGSELRRRGHDVTLVSLAPFAPLAARAGLPFVTLGTAEQFREAIAAPDLWRPIAGLRHLFRWSAELLWPTYEAITAHYRPGETIVVASILALAARVAQERLRLPLATVHLAPFLIRSNVKPPRLPGVALPRWLPPSLVRRFYLGVDRHVIDPLCAAAINDMRAALGLGPIRGVARWWNSPERIIAMFPDWYSPPQVDWPAQLKQVGFPRADRLGDRGELSDATRAFLVRGDRPIVFTFGSAMLHGGAFFATAVATCRRLGRRGVLIAPAGAETPGRLWDDILLLDYAPYSLLLPHCAAIVHHGGVGTTALALSTGTPQLIVPSAFDHFDEADRVRALGVGGSLSRRAFTPRQAAGALRALTASAEIAAACQTYKQQFEREDGVAAACEQIEADFERRRGQAA